MSWHDTTLSIDEAFVAELEHRLASGEAASVPDDVVCRAMSALIRVHGAKVDDGQRPRLLPEVSDVSATEVLVAASALLKAANLEIFELGMWQSWSGTR
jgi:hypothetical protein